MASSSSSPSSCTTWEHGVFLCFRGDDTREGFMSHLFQALLGSGIDTFMDDRLPKGRDISELQDRIEKSRVSVVVFSENFASSRWCLDELVKILECKEWMGQEVLPVFYKVPPSELRDPSKGRTAEYLAEHGEKHGVSSEKIEAWRQALRTFADLKGWHFTQGVESRLVSEIVETVQSMPDVKVTDVPPDQVSLEVDGPAEPGKGMAKFGKFATIAILVLKFTFVAFWLYLFLSLVPIAGIKDQLSRSRSDEVYPGIPRSTCYVGTGADRKPCDKDLLRIINGISKKKTNRVALFSKLFENPFHFSSARMEESTTRSHSVEFLRMEQVHDGAGVTYIVLAQS